VLAGRIELLQVPLGQTMEAQQQVIVILLQVRPGAGDQRIDVFRLIVERLQHAHLQRQLALATTCLASSTTVVTVLSANCG
jgi:hypothetical protein